MKQTEEEIQALESFNAVRAAHSLAHKRYMDFRKKLKTIPKDKVTVGDYREFLSLKDTYSEACKARNKAEIEFLASKTSTPFGKTPSEDRFGVLEIFDATLESDSKPSPFTATDMAKHEKMLEKGRLQYGGPGDSEWEKDREAALSKLRELGIWIPSESKEGESE